MTKQTEICDALEKLGYKEVKNYNTSKYRVFTNYNTSYYFFAGKAGGLRKGMTIGDSLSYPARAIQGLIKRANEVTK